MGKETYLSHALNVVGDAEPKYDTNVKYLLADVQVLSRILKYTVEEFHDMSFDEIISCIDFNSIKVEEENVDPGMTYYGRIRETATEDSIPNEGTNIYDVRFTAYCKKQEYVILVNVEAQKAMTSSRLHYHLENRIIFYLARMISAQKYTEFENDDYDNLKKVYSIWICMDGSKHNAFIDELKMNRERLFGKNSRKYEPDLMRGIIIRIRDGKGFEKSKNELISMLEVLLNREEVSEKKQVLTRDYGMVMTPELEGRMKDMCNLSDIIKEEGRVEGRAEGRAEGVLNALIQLVK